MAVATPFAFAPPYPASIGFSDSEKALSAVSAGSGAPGRTTYYLSRLFDFEGGTYTFKVNSDDTAAFFSAIEKTNGKFLFSHISAQGTTEFTVFIGRGRQRLDIVLGNLSAAASPCYVAFSIWQFGKLIYTSNAASWVIDTTPIDDADLPAIGDVRLTYPVFPLLPNWSGGLTERLEWMTEILPSESDAEQRRSQRRYPRRSIEASFLRKGVNRQRLDYFFNGMGKQECLLPLWHEQFPLHFQPSRRLWNVESFSEGLPPYTTLFGNRAIFSVAPNVYGPTLTIASQNSAAAAVERNFALSEVSRWSFMVNVFSAASDDAGQMVLTATAGGATGLWNFLPRREDAGGIANRPLFFWRNNTSSAYTSFQASASALAIGVWYKVEIYFEGSNLMIRLQNMTSGAVETRLVTTSALPLAQVSNLVFYADSGGATSGVRYADIRIESDQFTESQLGQSFTFPSGSLAQREFLPGTLAVAYESPTEFEVLSISEADYETDTITFEWEPLGSWGNGHRLIPLRVARLLEAVQFENLTDEVATARARFSLKDPEKWPSPTWGYCSPLFRFPVDRAQPINLDFSRSTFTLDNEVGPVDVLDLGEKTRVGMRVSVTLRGRDQVNRMRGFIHNARGRAVRFWMPSLMSDLTGWSDIDGADFTVRSAGFAEYMRAPQDSRRMLCIEFNDGRPNLYRTLVGAEPLGSTERLFVEPALPPISASIVRKMYFVMPVRFDQDGFELQHPVDDSAVVRTTLVMRSADMVGMPPIECLTTSRPYPINDSNRMASLAQFVTGRLQENLMVSEAMRVLTEFTIGTLIENVESYTYTPVERLESMAEFISGEIDGVVIETTAIETMRASVDFVSGTLIESLVAYTPAPERIEVTTQFLEGTLV